MLPPVTRGKPRVSHFFDIQDGLHLRDDIGTESADLHAAALEAKRPAIAVDEIPEDDERQTITVVVTDEEGHAVYPVVLTFVGTRLLRSAP